MPSTPKDSKFDIDYETEKYPLFKNVTFIKESNFSEEKLNPIILTMDDDEISIGDYILSGGELAAGGFRQSGRGCHGRRAVAAGSRRRLRKAVRNSTDRGLRDDRAIPSRVGQRTAKPDVGGGGRSQGGFGGPANAGYQCEDGQSRHAGRFARGRNGYAPDQGAQRDEGLLGHAREDRRGDP